MADDEQIDLEFFIEKDGRDISTLDMSRDEFDRIPSAVGHVRTVAHIESLYHLLVVSLVEFNEILTKEADYSRFARRTEDEISLYRLEGNRRAAGFLTTLDMYKECVCTKRGNSCFGIGRSRFESNGFGFCKALRNYIQHVGCFPLTISWNNQKLACSELLRSVHDLIPMDVLEVGDDNLGPSTRDALKALKEKQATVDVSQIFAEAMDVVSEIHSDIRQSKFYQETREVDQAFLSNIKWRFCDKGYHLYRYKGDAEERCRGRLPYLAQRQMALIDYLRRAYPATDKVARQYLVSMPPALAKRIADADKDVAQYVREGGVICRIKDHTYLSSKYQTPEIRHAYECG